MASLLALSLFLLLLSFTLSSASIPPINQTTAIINFPRRSLIKVRGSTPNPHSSVAQFHHYPLWVGAAISFSGGFALGPLIFLLWRLSVRYCTGSRRSHYEEYPAAEAPTLFSPMLRSPHNLSVVENLKLNGLPHSLEVVGRGGCGEVYKAELLVDAAGRRVPVAMKRICRQTPADATDLYEEEKKLLQHRNQQVRSEIRTVGRMRHPNLLRLLAHVPAPDCHLLVYEFMSNGSLHDALKHCGGALSWPTRYKIALGVAAGLEYLHEVHRPRVIHRDLKPANILLDEELNPRIADFGLAKVVPADARSGPMSSNHVAGTVGYIAPEYYRMLSCSDKCDIYSFGVILAVLVTGRFPSDEFFETTDEMCIVGWMRSVLLAEDPTPAIDTALVGNGFEEQMLLALKIACFCTYDDPKERPSSTDVWCMLAQIERLEV